MSSAENLHDLALTYHQRLPPRLWGYLNARGIPDDLIHKHLLGWNGQRITIPITDRNGEVVAFKLAKDPADATDSPKMVATPGARAELYGWEHVLAKPAQIIICEGEFDRLVLESHGFAAVTSTCGAGAFRPEWGPAFDSISSIYVCFDNDDAGREGAKRVAGVIPSARIVQLPAEVGEGGDVTDFFVRLRKTLGEFVELLRAAQPIPPRAAANSEPALGAPSQRARSSKFQTLKLRVAIVDLAGRYLPLRRNGARYVARCPFHADRSPSLVLYPETGTFHCFGCRAHGDVFTFLMRIERLTFREALDAIRNLSN